MNGANGNGSGAAQPVAGRLQLAGVVGLVAPLVATVSLFKATGTIGRIQRDEPGWLLAAIGAVLIAGALITLAAYFSGKREDPKGQSEGKQEYSWVKALFICGVGLTVIGFGIALILVVSNASAESRPQIAASLNRDESKLTAIVTASNLATKDRLVVKIDLATLKPGEGLDDKNPFKKGGSRGLERAYVGPNDDGKVKQAISVPIPRGKSYTDVIVRAFTGGGNIPCQKRPVATPDPGTACMFLALDRSKKRH
jgi:hypothetical protein